MSGGVCWYLWCLVLSLGVWRGVLVMERCFVMFWGVSEGSADAGLSQAVANPLL